MYLRDLQVVMSQHDFDLYRRAREVWEPIELRLQKRIPKRLDFGGVKKVSIRVGPNPDEKAYQVLIDVGVLHFPDFDVQAFLDAPRKAQVRITTDLLRRSFSSLAERFGTPVPWLIAELDAIDAEGPNKSLERTRDG